MLWSTFEVLINLCQAILMVFFLRNTIKVHEKYSWKDAALTTVIATFLTLHQLFDWHFSDSLVFLITTLYFILFTKGKWHQVLLWNLMLYSLMIAVVDTVIATFIGIFGTSWLTLVEENTTIRLVYVVSANVVLTCVLFLVTKVREPQTQLSSVSVAVLTMLNFVIAMLLEFQYSIREAVPIQNTTYMLVCFGLFLCSLLSIAIYHLMALSSEKEFEYKQQMQMLKVTDQYQSELQEIYRNLLSKQHDIKHIISALSQMNADDFEMSRGSMLQDFLKSVSVLSFATGRMALDALLTAEKLKMDKNEIAFEFRPQPTQDIPLSDAALCALIGNLLDNAIEAIERSNTVDTPKRIRLVFARAINMFMIRCINPADKNKIEVDGGYFKSSKHGAEHGQGIRSIQKIVEMAEGESTFLFQDGLFTVTICFYLRDGNNEGNKQKNSFMAQK